MLFFQANLKHAALWILFASMRNTYGDDVTTRRLRHPTNGDLDDSLRVQVPSVQKRRQLTVVNLVGDNGFPVSAYPLQKCQGDCDTDDDCEMGLLCLQRYENEIIPGCTGLSSETLESDICYDPDDRRNVTALTNKIHNGTLALVARGGKPPQAYPLQKCQGDCDHDGHCAGMLECFQRNPGDGSKTIPGCMGTALDDGMDYCYNPKDLPVEEQRIRNHTLTDKGIDWVPAKAYPLGLCEGDCDGDSDCEGELVCFQRYGLKPVPSCNGIGTENFDYCIHPKDDYDSIPPVPNAFRIKLYWQRGYDWQKAFWEEEWCMRCEFGNCNVTDLMYVYTCNGRSNWFLFDNLRNGTTNLRLAQTDLCIEIDINNDARMLPCNVSNSNQRFNAGSGYFNGKKFQLRIGEWCLANDHHPKAGEQLFLQDCWNTEWAHTDYWVKY